MSGLIGNTDAGGEVGQRVAGRLDVWASRSG